MTRMVAAEEINNRITSILKNMGFRTINKQIMEIDLLGNTRVARLIHAVSGDEKTIITVRMYRDGKHRIHISINNYNNAVLEKTIQQLENLGIKIHEDENGITAAAIITSNEIIEKLNRILEIVA